MEIYGIKVETDRWKCDRAPQNSRKSASKSVEPSRDFSARRKYVSGADVPLGNLYRDSDPRKKEKPRICSLVGLYEEIQNHLASCVWKTSDFAIKDYRRYDWPGIAPKVSQVEDEFNMRANRWRTETSFQSSLVAKFMHEDYQTIMAMGPPVIPLILDRLKTAHEHWFWALKHLAREDAAEGTDNPTDATRAWLKWGKEKGYIQ